MSNKISVIIDVAVDKANRSLKTFRQSVKEADTATGKFKAGAASMGATLKANAGTAALAAGGALVAFGAKAVKAASDLEESTNAVNKSFGKTAEGVLKIGEDSAKSFGLSQAAFNAAAVSFASFAQTVAGPGGDAARVIEDLVTRSADFASVMNIDVAEASTVFRSGLSGETEPLKKFGIDLSAAAVEAYALSSGLVETKAQMTESVKVQARYGLLMQKTGKFAGDFADTSDGLANSSRVLSASLTDLSAKFGEDLAPSIATAVGYAITFLDVVEGITGFGSMTVSLPGVNENDIESFRDFTELQQAAAAGNKKAQEDFRSGAKQLLPIRGYLGSVSDATRRYEEDVARLNDAQAINVATTKRVAEATAATTEEIEASWEALGKKLEMQEAVNESLLELGDSSLAYRNQEADTAAQIQESNRIMADGASTADEKAQADRDAEGAAYDLAAAAVKQAEDIAAAKNETLTAEEKAQIYRDELSRVASFMTGPARDAILGYIGLLGQIPKRVDTQVALNMPRRGPAAGGTSVYGAEGGIVNRPTVALIGEAGPEAVVPLHKTPGNGPLPSGLGGGGNVYNSITINTGADPEAVVNAIKKYSRRNGPGSVPL